VYVYIYIYTIDTIHDFLLGLQELATTQAMNACEIKVDMSSIQKESGSGLKNPGDGKIWEHHRAKWRF
jgi:hypothetical protein